MALRLSGFLKLRNWRAANAFLKAELAYQKGRYATALEHFEAVIQFERMRTSHYMAFYAVLMTLNKRPVEERLTILRRVAAGEFRHDHPDARYAEALAHYWIAYLTGRPDVVARWLDAYKLKPRKGWVLHHLPLPDNPVPS